MPKILPLGVDVIAQRLSEESVKKGGDCDVEYDELIPDEKKGVHEQHYPGFGGGKLAPFEGTDRMRNVCRKLWGLAPVAADRLRK